MSSVARAERTQRFRVVSIGDRVALIDEIETAIRSGDGIDRDFFDELDRKHRT